ncbi:MAG: type II secretion system protein GspJ, partial [Aeromicrobium sp.]|nr:type II secretion system protein GspJ [Burkholderiales bacterium]
DSSAAPQRVGYRLNEGRLELLIWDGIDVAPRAVPTAYTALKNVREFRWRVLDARGNWRADWPSRDDNSTPTFASTALPAALELTLTQGDAAPIIRMFALREVSGG